MNENAIEMFLSSDDNYLKDSLFECFTKEELKEALKGCYDETLNFKKYYRYF